MLKDNFLQFEPLDLVFAIIIGVDWELPFDNHGKIIQHHSSQV